METNKLKKGPYKILRGFVISHRRSVMIATLIVQVVISNYLSFVLRFESILSPEHVARFVRYLPLLLAIRLSFYLFTGLYKGLWRYASIDDLIKIVNTSALGSILFYVMVRFVFGDVEYPRSIYILDLLLFITISGGSRLLIRIFKEYMYNESASRKVLIVGAGDSGELLVRDIKNNPEHAYEPVGFIDDDPYKKGLTIHGVPILGPRSVIPKIIEKKRPDELLVSQQSADPSVMKEIYDLCKPYNIAVKKLPALGDILNGNVSVSPKLGQLLIDAGFLSGPQLAQALEMQQIEGGKLGSKLVTLGYISQDRLVQFLSRQQDMSKIKPLSLEDLLQREPVQTDIKMVRDYIGGKAVLVTGAGGSIGSELCRQILKYDPSNLILLDRYENSIFQIDRELREHLEKQNLSTVIGDIQDEAYLEHLFSKYSPRIIFHAAAYKHVPLMELNPIEAVKNNVFGTRNLLYAAASHHAESFVSISTDKAVNPSSVMGATKRIAEFLTINMDRISNTKCTTVRFGNVLGTNGSVVPIFREQLKKGGPLTVTHPEIKRFFMLIPEAMQLVLIAAAAGKGGEIFVLDMGEPIKIVELAENLIRLSGLVPHKEIKIRFSGLRPGEKLYEELFDASEKVLPTFHNKLKMAVSEVPSMALLDYHLLELDRHVKSLSAWEVMSELHKMLPNFSNGNHKIPEVLSDIHS